MKRNYLYVVRMDGDICGIEQHDLVVFDTDEPAQLSQFYQCIEGMARDHVSMYLDEDEYEEETGMEMEVESEIFHYTPEQWGDWYTCAEDQWHNREGYHNIAQDENGYWYVEGDK